MSKIIHATRRERASFNHRALYGALPHGDNYTLSAEPPRPARVVRVRGRRTRAQRQHVLASQFGFRARARRAPSVEQSWDAYTPEGNRS